MKVSFVLLILGLILLSGCEKNPDPDTFCFDEVEEFQLDVTYRSSDNRMQLTIDDVQDSRCPSQMMCIWAGEARVKVNLHLRRLYEIELSTTNDSFQLVQNYEIRLVNVFPYPEVPDQISRSDYRILLEIRRVN